MHISQSPKVINRGDFAYVSFFATCMLCTSIAFCHLSESRTLDPDQYYNFGAHEPFVYRIFLPLIFSGFSFVSKGCSTQLNFPIASCADLTALCVDSISLMITCALTFLSFKAIALKPEFQLRRPGLVIPVLLWMVVFNYVAVPNRSIYYPYDFPELMFFAGGAYLGTLETRGKYFLPLLTFISGLNKETALFLPFVYVIFVVVSGRLDRSQKISVALAVVAAILAKYFGFYYVISVVKAGAILSPKVYEQHFMHNLQQMLNPLAWLSWASAFGGAWILVFQRWNKMRVVNLLIIAIVLAWLAIVFVVGIAREIRLFGFLIFPLLVPIMLKIEQFLFPSSLRAED